MTIITQQPITERVQRWDVYDVADHLADLPAMIRRGGQQADRAARYVHRYAGVLFRAAERGGQVAPSVAGYQPVTAAVWLLDAEADFGGGDWAGARACFADRRDAELALDRFLAEHGIDRDAARWDQTVADTGTYGEPDPDTLDGIVVRFGITQMAVR